MHWSDFTHDRFECFQAKSAGLVHPLSQWLYIIPDTDIGQDNITGFATLLTEGDNVSFIYNRTSNQPECAVRELKFLFFILLFQSTLITFAKRNFYSFRRA